VAKNFIARSDFSNLFSSPATIEVKARGCGRRRPLILARRIGQRPHPGSQIIVTTPARRFPRRSDAALHVLVVASRSRGVDGRLRDAGRQRRTSSTMSRPSTPSRPPRASGQPTHFGHR
jgi:hypothetical protein